MTNQDIFAHKSKSWDMKSRRVQNAKSIADYILKNIKLTKDMHIMDFGAGTGLLSYFLSNDVGKVTALDNSQSMLEVFREKAYMFNSLIEILELDLTQNIPDNIYFDGIVSSMTMHHIQDIKDMLNKMYHMLPKGGFIALADLDKEDGTFHSDNIGVFHYGFDRDELKKIAQKVGFRDVQFETVNTIKKPHREFSVFLMIAKK
ncbi:MAG: class I SAM-dependent methyltransferase [Epsilonproteobacteria bacterium]|nr:class I SAM-dependent methyltransferase [Campylobacterota bacterium]